MTEAYPLQWPSGRPRTKAPESSRFRVTLGVAVQDVAREVEAIGGTDLVISTNLALRRDGLPYATRRRPTDNGVAVYFTLKKKPMCFACDRWLGMQENLRAVAKTIEALRGIARWGSGQMVELAFTGFTALPAPEQWWQVLHVREHASAEEIDRAFRRLASEHHPDHGGDPERMARINRARDQGMERHPCSN